MYYGNEWYEFGRGVNIIYNMIEESANRLIVDTDADDDKDVDEIAFHNMTRSEVKEKYRLGSFNSENINNTNDDTKNKGNNYNDKGKGGKKKKNKDKKKFNESNNMEETLADYMMEEELKLLKLVKKKTSY